MKRRSRAALAALFALPVLALSACGSEPGAADGGATVVQAGAAQPAAPAEPFVEPPSAAEGGPEEPMKAGARAIETARLAYEKTTEARSAKVTMLTEFSGTGGGFSTRTDGVVDFERDVSSFITDTPRGDGPKRTRQVGTVIYEKPPEPMRSNMPDAKPWIKLDLEDLLDEDYPGEAKALEDGNPTPMESQLEFLRSVSDSVTKIGMAPVRGVPTTHYRARVDLGEAAAGENRQTRRSFADMREMVGEEEIWVEMWVDGDGRMRRSIIDVPMSEGSEARLRITEEMYDFGAPVTVKPPAADQVTEVKDFGEFMRATTSP